MNKEKNSISRIIILGLNYFPEPTGIGKYTGEMAVYLADNGYKVRVITTPPYYPQWKVQPPYRWWQYRRENISGVDVFRCPVWVPSRLSGLKRIIHLLTFAFSSIPVIFLNLFWKPDLVFTVAPSFFNTPCAWLAARLCGAAAWLHVQDFEIDAAVNLELISSGSFLTNLMRRIERWMFKKFDRVSSISHQMAVKLKEKGVKPERIRLLPNWVDTEAIFPLEKDAPDVTAMKEDFRLPDEKIIVLYAGNMGRKQGLEYVLETARLLKDRMDILFLFCGDGSVRSKLERMAEGESNIRFLPLQPPDNLNVLLNMADIHLLPQRADAADFVMPSKLSGMLASGKAVIAAARQGTELAEVVSHSGIVVFPEDIQSLADAISHLVDSPAERASYGKKGREWVVDNWTTQKVLESMELEMRDLSKIRSR